MARRAERAKRKSARAVTPAPGAPGPHPPRRDRPASDPRRWIYAGLDVLSAAGLAIAIWTVIPNRLPSATIHLWTFPVAELVMAAGMVLGRTRGARLAVAGGTLALASLAVLVVRIAVSAAFLAGVYGGLGKAAATFALVVLALAIELVALVPALQIKYVMSRAGRRALGAAPP